MAKQKTHRIKLADWQSDLKLSNRLHRLYLQVLGHVDAHSRVAARIEAIENEGIQVYSFPMGPGGVGQVRVMRDGIRVQIGYGQSKHNYAHAAWLAFNQYELLERKREGLRVSFNAHPDSPKRREWSEAIARIDGQLLNLDPHANAN